MRELIAPRAAERRWRASAHGSSSLSARRTLSSWPITFLVRLTRSSFSREVCDILLAYPMGVWYQHHWPVSKGCENNRTKGYGSSRTAGAVFIARSSSAEGGRLNLWSSHGGYGKILERVQRVSMRRFIFQTILAAGAVLCVLLMAAAVARPQEAPPVSTQTAA